MISEEFSEAKYANSSCNDSDDSFKLRYKDGNHTVTIIVTIMGTMKVVIAIPLITIAEYEDEAGQQKNGGIKKI